MKFNLTESQVSELTGYSTRWLSTLRRGGKQTQNGKEYKNKAVLVEGKDYTAEAHGKTVVVKYSEQAVEKLNRRMRDGRA
jgi:hypothetical protein